LAVVTKYPSDPGPAAWNELLPAVAPRQSLQGKQTTDWLVIGAGFAGLSAARRLSELHPGARIVVLEASAVAHGPAGRNSGFMIDVPHDLTSDDYGGKAEKDHRDIRLNRAGIDYALDAKSAYGMSDEAICSSGKINGAVSARGVSHNDGYAQHLTQLSEPFERLSAADMQKLTGSAAYIDGLYTPGTAMLQPAMYIRALAEGIENAGVTIFEQSPVIELKQQRSVWQAATPNGAIQAGKVVLTVNGHLQSFGYYQRQLVHIYTYGSMTRELTSTEVQQLGGEKVWALTPADPLGTTVRRISGTGGDRLIVRNRATYNPSLNVGDDYLKQVAEDHDRSFIYRFPMLKHVDMQYRWGGQLCLSRNNVPVFGEVESNLYAACCQNGLGTAKGSVSGKLIAEFASGHTSALLEDQQAEVEPSTLPPEPFASIGAKAILRWGEYRAGREL
jgi:glycine/D-amino acid oxidase-like deaminating enzyme